MSSTIDTINAYPDISFIDDYTLDQMMGDMVRDFQDRYRELTGEEMELGAADPNRLILYAAAPQIYQGLQNIDKAGKMNLLKYSYGDYLDNLAGYDANLKRSEGSYAVATLRFTLSGARESAVAIPMGTRAANSANVCFYTTEAAEIPAGGTYVDVPAQCAEAGTEANGIEIGELNVLVDAVAYVGGVANLDKPQGGADRETDDQLKERIYLHTDAYSTAGTEGSYRYWTLQYSGAIEDVLATSEAAGEADIYVTLKGGELPGESFCEAVREYLTGVCPMTDKVVVKAPAAVPYDLKMTYYIPASSSASVEAIQAEAESAVEAYVAWQQGAIGRDVTPDKLTQLIVSAGAKRAEIASPVFTKVGNSSIAQAGEISVTYGGLEDD